jgi:hypothetical protein
MWFGIYLDIDLDSLAACFGFGIFTWVVFWNWFTTKMMPDPDWSSPDRSNYKLMAQLESSRMRWSAGLAVATALITYVIFNPRP